MTPDDANCGCTYTLGPSTGDRALQKCAACRDREAPLRTFTSDVVYDPLQRPLNRKERRRLAAKRRRDRKKR